MKKLTKSLGIAALATSLSACSGEDNEPQREYYGSDYESISRLLRARDFCDAQGEQGKDGIYDTIFHASSSVPIAQSPHCQSYEANKAVFPPGTLGHTVELTHEMQTTLNELVEKKNDLIYSLEHARWTARQEK